MRLKQRAVAVLLALCCMLTGCGQETDAEENAPKVDDVKVSNAHFGLSYYETGEKSPVLDDSDLNQLVYEAMYEGLFEVGGSFTAVPVLCDTYTMEGRTFSFHLKPGVTFWDGTPLTAEDVVTSLRIAWENESSQYFTRMRQVESISANGTSEVVMTLYSANVNFPRLLNIPICRATKTESGFNLGTGPFVPEKNGTQLRLLANQGWHKGFLGSIRTIDLVAVSHVDAALSSFKTGDISVLRAMRVARDPLVLSGAVDTVQTASANLHFLGLNHSCSKLQDKQVRQAISTALNRKNICDVQLQTFADPAVLPINPQPSTDTIAYSLDADVEKAIALLAGEVPQGADTPAPAGADTEYDEDDESFDDYDDEDDWDDSDSGDALRFIVNESNTYKVAAAEQIASTLGTVGLTVNLVKLSDDAFQEALRDGNFDLYYGETRMTPDFDLRGLLGADGALNFGHYRSESMDSAIAAARAGEDTQALYALLLDEMPIVPIAFLRQQMIVRQGLFTVFDPAPYNMFAAVENWESE